MGQNDNPYVNKIDSINAQFLDGANLSVDVTLGGAYPEDEKIPSEKAVKTYIDNAVTGGVVIDHSTLSNKSYANSGHTGFKKANIRMNVAPTVDDDILSGYENDDIWHDVVGDRMYVCKDNTAGTAVWKEIVTQDSDVLDSRYYTETEVDTLLDDYSPTTDLYTATQLDNGQLDTRYYTETEIDTNIYTSAETDAAIKNSVVPKRQTVLYGGIDANGYANFLTGTGTGTLTLDATPTAVVATWASGDTNYKSTISADLTLDISGYGNGTYYAYLDYNNGTPTLGAVALVPTDGYGAGSTTANQHHFRIPEMKMYVGNGSAAVEVLRVFVGEFTVASGVIQNVAGNPLTYALRGEYYYEQTTGNFQFTHGTPYEVSHNIPTSKCNVGLYAKFHTAVAGQFDLGAVTPIVAFQSSDTQVPPYHINRIKLKVLPGVQGTMIVRMESGGAYTYISSYPDKCRAIITVTRLY